MSEFDHPGVRYTVNVVINHELPDLEPFYTYLVPEHMVERVKPGLLVHVPFGTAEVIGTVWSPVITEVERADSLQLRPLKAVLEDAPHLQPDQLNLVAWLARECCCDIGSAMRCVTPPWMAARVEVLTALADPELDPDTLGSSMARRHVAATLVQLGGTARLDDLKKACDLPSFSSAYRHLIKQRVLIETRRIVRTGVSVKTERVACLAGEYDTLTTIKLTGKQQAVMAILEQSRADGVLQVPVNRLVDQADVGQSVIAALVTKGLITIDYRTVRRAPMVHAGAHTITPVLTSGQAHAVDSINKALQSGTYSKVLLFGVTASGKTEVYLSAISTVLQQGKGAMVLLPEIALTAQVADVFIARFGDRVALLHSNLGEGERLDEWHRLQNNEAQIVVGARSAVFAPIQNLGLVIVDEEHETSYKQESTPRYNARSAAQWRSETDDAVLVLGSATPSLETFFQTDQAESSIATMPQATLVEMPDRISNRPLPAVRIADMREEFKNKPVMFSAPLLDAMADRFARKEQVILFLNRRGYSQFVLCRDCGWTARCASCDVSLTYHAHDRSLRCHHCGFRGPAPSICTVCGGSRVRGFGVGTERVEEEVRTLFPQVTTLRMDRDTTSRRGDHARLIRTFRQREADILIGTQMVAKGLDFPYVTLVGVISADTTLNMPDFRAAERTFQLLAQVAGRAGRGDLPGEVFVQTFTPEHYAIRCALSHDFRQFYNTEMVYRRELRYPPFTRFANLIIAGTNETTVSSQANELARHLRLVADGRAEVIGPSAAPLAKLKDNYRFHCALRSPLDLDVPQLIREVVAGLPRTLKNGLTVDIDPYSML